MNSQHPITAAATASISFAAARQPVLDCILSFWTTDDDPVILDHATIERDFGSMFFWQSRRAMDGERCRRLIGNGPIIVSRFDGSICRCGSGRPSEFYLDHYAAASPTERTTLQSIV
jgi:hypothetical protein